jgi:hypothetical protein
MSTLTPVADALGTPDPPPQAPPGLDELAGHLMGRLTWGVLTAGSSVVGPVAGAGTP